MIIKIIFNSTIFAKRDYKTKRNLKFQETFLRCSRWESNKNKLLMVEETNSYYNSLKFKAKVRILNLKLEISCSSEKLVRD